MSGVHTVSLASDPWSSRTTWCPISQSSLVPQQTRRAADVRVEEVGPEDGKGSPLSAHPPPIAHKGRDQPDTKLIPCCVMLCSAPHTGLGLCLRDGTAFCIVLSPFCRVFPSCAWWFSGPGGVRHRFPDEDPESRKIKQRVKQLHRVILVLKSVVL